MVEGVRKETGGGNEDKQEEKRKTQQDKTAWRKHRSPNTKDKNNGRVRQRQL